MSLSVGNYERGKSQGYGVRHKKSGHPFVDDLSLVGVDGFEPPTLCL